MTTDASHNARRPEGESAYPTLHDCPRCDCQQVQDNGSVSDGFGSTWAKCERGAACGLEVVRPGKVQCWCDDGSTEPPNYDDEDFRDAFPFAD